MSVSTGPGGSSFFSIPARPAAIIPAYWRYGFPAGNPYLQYAGMIAAGLAGIEKKLEPPGPVETDIYALTAAERRKLGIASLPGSLEEALDELEGSELMRETLGSHIFPHYLYIKRQEWDDYRIRVTDYELDRFLPILCLPAG